MGGKTLLIIGGCMCGAVRYATTGKPIRVLNCHCQSCRRHTGAPMVTLAVFKADHVEFSGDARKIHQSSPGVGRGFCGECGTPLTWETGLDDLGPVCALHVSTCDNPDALQPSAHTAYSERIAWFDVADNLPRHQGMSINSSIMRYGPESKEQPD